MELRHRLPRVLSAKASHTDSGRVCWQTNVHGKLAGIMEPRRQIKCDSHGRDFCTTLLKHVWWPSEAHHPAARGRSRGSAWLPLPLSHCPAFLLFKHRRLGATKRKEKYAKATVISFPEHWTLFLAHPR